MKRQEIRPGVEMSGLSFKVYDWKKYLGRIGAKEVLKYLSRRSSEAEHLVANQKVEISKFSVCSKQGRIDD